jgi:hypothetical protein
MGNRECVIVVKAAISAEILHSDVLLNEDWCGP